MKRGLGALLFALSMVLWPALPASAGIIEDDFGPGGPAPAGDATATAPSGSVIPATCWPRHRSSDDALQRRHHVVTASYCAILRRNPDPAGLEYWSAQLDNGLSTYDLIELLLDSPEYRARQSRTFQQSLTALSLGPGRQAERDAQVPGLRRRTPITPAEFDLTVTAGDIDEIEFITPALAHGRLVGNGQRVNVAYVHLSATRGMRVSPGDRRRATVGTWAAEIGAHVAVNANWYGPYDGPAVSGGNVYGGRDHFYTALFGFTADGDAVIEHHRETNDEVDTRIVEAVAGHPTLLYQGERTTDFGGDPAFTARHPRTAIGLDRSGDVLILVTVDGRSSTARGMTGDETARLMERLGADDAVMLDGGGSSTMWIAGRGIVNRPSGGPRAVGNQIAVFGD